MSELSAEPAASAPSRRRSAPAPATPRPTPRATAGREVRVYGGEVESLTAATQTRHRRPRLDRPAGRLRLRHRPLRRRRRRRSPRAPPRRPRSPTRTSSPAPPAPAEIEALAGLERPRAGRRWTPSEVAELALTVERTALAADPRVAGGRDAVYADSAERVAIASSTGVAGEYEAPAASPTCRRWPRATAAARPASASASPAAPTASTRRRSAPRGPSGRVAMIGAAQARVALLPGRPRPDRRRQLRRPDRRRARRRRRPARPLALRRPPRRGGRLRGASPCTTTAATPRAPPRPRSTARACRAAARALIEGGAPARLPLRHLHGQPRGRRTRPATRLARRLPLAALGLGLEPGRRARRRSARGAAAPRPARASTSPTSPACTRASTRSPASSRSAPPAA